MVVSLTRSSAPSASKKRRADTANEDISTGISSKRSKVNQPLNKSVPSLKQAEKKTVTKEVQATTNSTPKLKPIIASSPLKPIATNSQVSKSSLVTTGNQKAAGRPSRAAKRVSQKSSPQTAHRSPSVESSSSDSSISNSESSDRSGPVSKRTNVKAKFNVSAETEESRTLKDVSKKEIQVLNKLESESTSPPKSTNIESTLNKQTKRSRRRSIDDLTPNVTSKTDDDVAAASSKAISHKRESKINSKSGSDDSFNSSTSDSDSSSKSNSSVTSGLNSQCRRYIESIDKNHTLKARKRALLEMGGMDSSSAIPVKDEFPSQWHTRAENLEWVADAIGVYYTAWRSEVVWRPGLSTSDTKTYSRVFCKRYLATLESVRYPSVQLGSFVSKEDAMLAHDRALVAQHLIFLAKSGFNFCLEASSALICIASHLGIESFLLDPARRHKLFPITRGVNSNGYRGLLYRGVSWSAEKRAWKATVHIMGSEHTKTIGYFGDPIEAAKAYDRGLLARIMIYDLATLPLNFPDGFQGVNEHVAGFETRISQNPDIVWDVIVGKWRIKTRQLFSDQDLELNSFAPLETDGSGCVACGEIVAFENGRFCKRHLEEKAAAHKIRVAMRTENPPVCLFPECPQPRWSSGFCRKHFVAARIVNRTNHTLYPIFGTNTLCEEFECSSLREPDELLCRHHLKLQKLENPTPKNKAKS